MRCAHFVGFAFATLLFTAAQTARAQLDFLPSIPQGSISVRLLNHGNGFDGNLGDAQTPTDLAFPTDGSGRLFAAMQLGKVRVLDAQKNLLPTFMDTVSESTPSQPHFFTAFAFHKGFAAVGKPGYGKFYTLEVEHADTAPADFANSLITRPDGFQQVLYEYQVSDITSNAFDGTKREVIRFDRPGDTSGHNVGDLAFGRDGYLYIANGDGGNDPNPGDRVAVPDNAQYLGNVFGKILRIDPLAPTLTKKSKDPVSANGKYRVPRTNPFNEPASPTEDKTVDEIFAYGLRNPYRINFDRLTDELYVGNVGQANIEGVYKVTPGANLGWNQKEGSFILDRFNQDNLTPDIDADGNGLLDFSEAHGLTDPLFEYDHEDGVAVLSGFVYRGKQIPALYGKFVFADFAGGRGDLQGRLLYGDLDTKEIFEMKLSPESVPLPSFLYTVGQDARGELYLSGTTADGTLGSIVRLTAPRVPRVIAGSAVISGPQVARVPEPSTFALGAVALVGMLAIARRRRHA
jgi:hypothetical protein